MFSGAAAEDRLAQQTQAKLEYPDLLAEISEQSASFHSQSETHASKLPPDRDRLTDAAERLDDVPGTIGRAAQIHAAKD